MKVAGIFFGRARARGETGSMSSQAAEYWRRAKECSEAVERTTDPEVREMLLKLVADLTAAALSAVSSGSTPVLYLSWPGVCSEPSR